MQLVSGHWPVNALSYIIFYFICKVCMQTINRKFKNERRHPVEVDLQDT